MKSQWIIAGVALALIGPGVRAQDTPNTPAAGIGMSGATPDLSILVNSPYDYTQLKQAKARGLSDSDIASVAKISRLTGVSFQEVVDAVLRGTTFADLAQKYNLTLSNVLDVNDEESKIAAYMAAYEATNGSSMSSSSLSSTSSSVSEMQSKFQSLYSAIHSAAVGPAMQFPYTPQPPAPVYAAPAPAPMPAPVPVPEAAPAPAPTPEPVVRATRAIPQVRTRKVRIRRRMMVVRPKRHIVLRKRVRRVKRVIFGS